MRPVGRRLNPGQFPEEDPGFLLGCRRTTQPSREPLQVFSDPLKGRLGGAGWRNHHHPVLVQNRTHGRERREVDNLPGVFVVGAGATDDAGVSCRNLNVNAFLALLPKGDQPGRE